MTTAVEKIAAEVKALPEREFEEFLSWLAGYELAHFDRWDREMERDSRSGGRLDAAMKRARADIAAGRTRPLNEFIDNT